MTLATSMMPYAISYCCPLLRSRAPFRARDRVGTSRPRRPARYAGGQLVARQAVGHRARHGQ
eukprot:11168991-Lingulodinium_polyedra.AAC.1